LGASGIAYIAINVTGFATMAVAFYGVDDLPKVYGSTDVEYFEEALSFATKRREVDPDRIGVFGSSKGMRT
jgi:hypothetical protein